MGASYCPGFSAFKATAEAFSAGQLCGIFFSEGFRAVKSELITGSVVRGAGVIAGHVIP